MLFLCRRNDIDSVFKSVYKTVSNEWSDCDANLICFQNLLLNETFKYIKFGNWKNSLMILSKKKIFVQEILAAPFKFKLNMPLVIYVCKFFFLLISCDYSSYIIPLLLFFRKFKNKLTFEASKPMNLMRFCLNFVIV